MPELGEIKSFPAEVDGETVLVPHRWMEFPMPAERGFKASVIRVWVYAPEVSCE